ncbi:MAG: hypothetical protein JRC90_06770 [Deltaproteobacteria bacterium]|nr:hypothetical protein [Deltaproteobacteria bacterium]
MTGEQAFSSSGILNRALHRSPYVMVSMSDFYGMEAWIPPHAFRKGFRICYGMLFSRVREV